MISITNIAIKRPTIVVVFFTVLALLGIFSYTKLKYDLVPKMNLPTITIVTQYPGASAAAIESSITKKIEDAVASLENVNNLQSTSMEGVSTVSISLKPTADANKILQDAQRLINANISQLPAGIKSPTLNKFSLDDAPVMKIGASGHISSSELYLIMDEQIKPQIQKIEGVGQVTLIGGEDKEIKIEINKDKLQIYNLNIGEVYQAINEANLELPAGKIESSTQDYAIRLAGKAKNLEDLQNIPVKTTDDGGIITLSDIAEIVKGSADPKNMNRINGQNSIGLQIQKQSDANTVDVSKNVQKELKNIEAKYSNKGIRFDIASDSSTYTLASVHAVMEDLVLAIILVAIVMFLFLHSYRNSLIVLVSIPASIVSVFAAMYIFDFTLNLMTLMALSLVIGILVDDSIVVLENIHRHLTMGKDSRKAALDGRNEIGFTAIAITLVDVVVFVPLSMVTGLIGGLLKEFSLVIVFSTIMSLLVSFTITPLLASRFGKIEQLNHRSITGRMALWFESFFVKMTIGYESVLRWSLHHRRVIYGGTMVLLLGSLTLVAKGFIGTEFSANGDRGEFTIKIEGEPQNNLFKTNKITEKVENILYGKPEVLKVFSSIGYSGAISGTGADSPNKSELTVTIVPKNERKQTVDEYAASIKKELEQIPGIRVTATPTGLMGNADDAPIQILLRGTDISTIYTVADSIMNTIKTVPGATDIKLSVDKNKPELQIALDRNKMALLGLSVNTVASTLRLAFAGNNELKFSGIRKDLDIRIQFDPSNRQKIEDLKNTTFKNKQGALIPFQDFATIQQKLGPSQLTRYDRMTSVTVNAGVNGRPVGTVGKEVQDIISKNIHSKDVAIDYKGQMERQSEAFGSLGLVMIAALIFVYLVMVALYNSYLYPFVVLFSIPLAIIGALLALALSGTSLSIFSMLGFIMLIGLVAKNAILIVDFANKLRDEGLNVFEALVEAGRERLRPILMTTLAMIFGMLPIALATGASAEMKNGLAWVIIGGLTSSLLLTLVLVPAVYMTMNKYINKFNQTFHKHKSTTVV